MEISLGQARNFCCLFCQKPYAIPVNDIQRFNEHMQESHMVVQDHTVLLALHFTNVKENEEIIDRVKGEMFHYLDIKNHEIFVKDITQRKVGLLNQCSFCNDITEKGTFKEHLSMAHNIFFGHELFIASKLLTTREKEQLIERVRNKAIKIKNVQTIWKAENVTCHACLKRFISGERLEMHVSKQCPNCKKCFSSAYKLRRHSSAKNTKFDRCLKPKEICTECKKVCKNRVLLMKHERKHKKKINILLKCRDCQREFSSKRVLAIHKKRRRTCVKDVYSCDNCSEKFSTKHLMKKHKCHHNGKKSRTCYNCWNIMKEQKYNFHLKSCLAYYTLFEMICGTCFKCFEEVRKYQTHLTLRHFSGGQFKCEMCVQTCATAMLLKKHAKKRHYYTFECKLCSKRLSSQSNLQQHMLLHSDEKDYECNICLKQYATKTVLINHARTYHPNEVDSIVKIKKPLEPDEEVVAMMEICQTGWKCISCGKIAKYRHDIKEHVEMVHLKRRPFVCIKCDKSYSTKGTYEAHGRWHTGEKNYSCHTCKKAFIQKGTLRKHEIVHLKVWPHPCLQCHKSFTQSGSLRYHVNLKHSS